MLLVKRHWSIGASTMRVRYRCTSSRAKRVLPALEEMVLLFILSIFERLFVCTFCRVLAAYPER